MPEKNGAVELDLDTTVSETYNAMVRLLETKKVLTAFPAKEIYIFTLKKRFGQLGCRISRPQIWRNRLPQQTTSL